VGSKDLPQLKSKELRKPSNLNEFMQARAQENEETIKKVTDTLDRAGMDDEYIFVWLFKRIFKPSIILADGEYHFDRSASLRTIKNYWKLRWHIRGKITLEELFWMDFSKKNKNRINQLIDESWAKFKELYPEDEWGVTPDNDVYKKLREINEKAYFVIRVWKDEFARSPDNSIRWSAHSEMIKLKQYLSDDETSTVLQFFKVDLERQDRILALG